MPTEPVPFPECLLCGRSCTNDDFCYGCNAYICYGHREGPWGSHSPDSHTEPSKEDEEE